MVASLDLVGADRFVSTTERAAKEIADMREGMDEAGRILSSAGAAAAPRRTGALAGSLRSERGDGPNTASITSPLVYAVPIHWGSAARNIEANPFLLRAAETTESQWMKPIETDAQRILDEVEGA